MNDHSFPASAQLSAAIGSFALLATLLSFRAGIGVNLPLIAGLVILLALWRSGTLARHPRWWPPLVQVQLAMWSALAIATVWHLDAWTCTMLLLATITLCGSLWFGPADDPLRATARALVQLLHSFGSYISALTHGRRALTRLYRQQQSLASRLLIPLAISLVFCALYSLSNAQLAAQWEAAFVRMQTIQIYADLLHPLALLFVWSVLGAGLVYHRSKLQHWLAQPLDMHQLSHLASAKTWSTASVTLLAVNGLALMLNGLDGMSTWLGEAAVSGAELTRGVHQGTNTLIIAIVLAAGLILYYLRHPPADHDRVRMLAIAWLAQNAVMVATVGLRNFQYMDAYGLTYKRLGVWLFLISALGGLALLGKTAHNRTSLEWLVRRQAWCVYGVLAAAALPNWSNIITSYNLSPSRQHHDSAYLRQLLPHNASTWYSLRPDDPQLNKWLARYPEVVFRDWREWDLAQAKRQQLLLHAPTYSNRAQ